MELQMCDKSLNLKKSEYLRNRFLIILEERRPGYTYYELLVFLSNVVGALYMVTRKLAEAEINILMGMHTHHKEEGIWISFIEVPESVSVEKTLEEISSLNVVSGLKYQKMERADIFDKFLFPLSLFDRRMVAITDYMYHSLKKAIMDVLKSGGETMMYMQGQSLGEGAINVFKERFREELTSEEDALHLVKDTFRAFGWGIIEFQGINPRAKTGSIIIDESMEYTESSKIKCHFLRGLVTGALRKIFNDETIKLVEVKCKSEGAPYCEFHFV